MKEEVTSTIDQMCTHLQKFSFDKAKELIEDFRVKHNVTNCSNSEVNAWSGLLQCLSSLTVADKNYMALSFLSPKGFFRKESSLRPNYNAIKSDLDKLCNGLKDELPTDCRETLVCHLLHQFGSYVAARIAMMSCYENLSSLTTGKAFNVDQAIEMFREIEDKHVGTFHHPLLSALELSFSYECQILLNFLNCYNALSQMKFLDCLMLLQEARSSFQMWSHEGTEGSSKFQQGSSWFNLTGATKSHALPSLCLWLKRFYDALLAKYTLYFYDLLSAQTNAQEMRAQLSKLRINYYQQIVNFHRKHDAGNICLILNAQELNHLQWQGYHHPDRHYEPLKGLENFPMIFCHPLEKPAYLLPSVVMILTEHADKLLQMEKIVPVYDKTKEAMFFVTRVEASIFLVLTFNGRRSDRDSHIISFISELCCELRLTSVFSSLKASK